MSEYLIKKETLTAIADAVRAKNGTTAPISVVNLADEISNIPTSLEVSSEEELLALDTPENVGKVVTYNDALYIITED